MLKHMTSLRTQYTRCVRSGIAASTALARTPRQKWLVRELAFLKPHLKSRPLPSTYHRPLVRMPTARQQQVSRIIWNRAATPQRVSRVMGSSRPACVYCTVSVAHVPPRYPRMHGGSALHLLQRFLDPHESAGSISIGSSVSAQLIRVYNTHRDHAACDMCRKRPHLRTARGRRGSLIIIIIAIIVYSFI